MFDAVRFRLTLPALLRRPTIVIIILLFLDARVPRCLLSLFLLLLRKLYLLLAAAATVEPVLLPLFRQLFLLPPPDVSSSAILLNRLLGLPDLHLLRLLQLLHLIVKSLTFPDCCPELLVNTIIGAVVLIIRVEKLLPQFHLQSIQALSVVD